ncbi:MAG: hypothetical protein QOE31_1788, partial [Solirubrobacteraceae bacterium]|nr:hypothetical protein [Solirubrobacteraceae bacterium]
MPGAALTTTYLWVDGTLLGVAEGPAGALLAADSWLVDDGRVRGYDAHWARFGGCCESLRVARSEVA